MNPDDEIKDFEKTMKRLLEGFFGRGNFEFFPFGPMRAASFQTSTPGQMSPVREPMTDINETKEEVIVTVELPGASKDSIDLDVTPNGIEISARTQKFEDKKGVHKSSMSTFQKFMSLPVEVDPSKVKATYKNGILEVHMKKIHKAKGKKVKIE